MPFALPSVWEELSLPLSLLLRQPRHAFLSLQCWKGRSLSLSLSLQYWNGRSFGSLLSFRIQTFPIEGFGF